MIILESLFYGIIVYTIKNLIFKNGEF